MNASATAIRCERRCVQGGIFCIVGAVIVNFAIAWICAWWELPRSGYAEYEASGDLWRFQARLPTAPQPVGVCEGFGVTARYINARWSTELDGAKTGLSEVSNDLFGFQGRKSAAYSWRWAEAARRWSNPVNPLPTIRLDAGWPFRAFEGWVQFDSSGEPSGVGALVVNKSVEQSYSLGPQLLRVLPWVPKWPGFVLNMLAYGALLWILVAFASARRAAKLRKTAAMENEDASSPPRESS